MHPRHWQWGARVGASNAACACCGASPKRDLHPTFLQWQTNRWSVDSQQIQGPVRNVGHLWVTVRSVWILARKCLKSGGFSAQGVSANCRGAWVKDGLSSRLGWGQPLWSVSEEKQEIRRQGALRCERRWPGTAPVCAFQKWYLHTYKYEYKYMYIVADPTLQELGYQVRQQGDQLVWKRLTSIFTGASRYNHPGVDR